MKKLSREDLEKRIEALEKKVAELEGSVQEQPKQQLLAKKTTITFKKLKDSIFEVELLIGSLHLKGKAIQIPSNTHNIFSVIYLEASND